MAIVKRFGGKVAKDSDDNFTYNNNNYNYYLLFIYYLF